MTDIVINEVKLGTEEEERWKELINGFRMRNGELIIRSAASPSNLVTIVVGSADLLINLFQEVDHGVKGCIHFRKRLCSLNDLRTNWMRGLQGSDDELFAQLEGGLMKNKNLELDVCESKVTMQLPGIEMHNGRYFKLEVNFSRRLGAVAHDVATLPCIDDDGWRCSKALVKELTNVRLVLEELRAELPERSRLSTAPSSRPEAESARPARIDANAAPSDGQQRLDAHNAVRSQRDRMNAKNKRKRHNAMSGTKL